MSETSTSVGESRNMHEAARDDNIDVLEELLEEGRDVDEPHPEHAEDTPLQWAAYHGKTNAVLWLLEHDARVNHRGKNGGTPLYWAVERNHMDVAMVLLHHGADPNVVVEDTGASALHVLARNHAALGDYEMAVLVMLREAGADPDLAAKDGSTARQECDKATTSGEQTDEAGFTVYGETLRTKIITCEPADLPWRSTTSLNSIAHIAAAVGLVGLIVKRLQLRPAQSEVKNMLGRTIMHELASAPRLNCTETSAVRTLMALGVSRNTDDNLGQTPLHLAATSSNYEMALQLVNARAEPALGDVFDNTPLHYANDELGPHLLRHSRLGARSVLGHLAREAAAELQRSDRRWPSEDDVREVHRALRAVRLDRIDPPRLMRDDPFELPRPMKDLTPCERARAKTSIFQAARYGDVETLNDFLRVKGLDLDACGPGDCNPLHRGVIGGYEAIVRNLLRAGANVQAVTTNDWFAPLHFAVVHSRVAMIRLLHGAGAKLNVATRYEGTAFAISVNRGIVPCFDVLVALGADINIPDDSGHSPLHVACERGNRDMVYRLLAAGAAVDAQTNAFLNTPGNAIGSTWQRSADGLSPEMHAIVTSFNFLNRRPPYTPLTAEQRKELTTRPPENLSLEVAASTVSLHMDVRNNNASGVIWHVYVRGADVNGKWESGDLPIIWAGYFGRPAMCALLVEFGADINVPGRNGGTALLWAVTQRHEPTALVLLHLGADPRIPNAHGETPLHIAAMNAERSLIARLLQYGAPVSHVNNDGQNALHYAFAMSPLARPGPSINMRRPNPEREALYFDIAVVLCQNDINRRVADRWNKTPMDAAPSHTMEVVRRIIDTTPVVIWSPTRHFQTTYHVHHEIRVLLSMRITRPDGEYVHPDCPWTTLNLDDFYAVCEALVRLHRRDNARLA